jgi:hypothetical protein
MPAARDQRLHDIIASLGPTHADSVRRVDALATLLDSSIPIPGTNRTVGLDAVFGLVPVFGDAISAALSSYIIWEAKRLGLPRWKIARMVSNVAVDTVVGVVPFVGDLFDAAYKSNRRNIKIILDHLASTGQAKPGVIEGSYRRLDETGLRDVTSGKSTPGAQPRKETIR